MRKPHNDHLVLIATDSRADWLPLEVRLHGAGYKIVIRPWKEMSTTLLSPLPDALIIDQPLSPPTGLAFYRKVVTQARREEIPALLVIALEEEDIVSQILAEEHLDIISRPLSAEMIIHRLRTLMRGVGRHKHLAEKVEDRLLLLKEAVDSLPIGITLSDTSGKIVYSNPTEALMHGYFVEELIGKDAGAFAKPNMRKPFVPKNLEGIEVWKRESTNVRKDGSEFPVQLTSIAVRSIGRCLGVVTICEDISEKKESERLIYQLAHLDSLTGLPNRRLFQDRLNLALALARREEGKVCLAYMDLDNFKYINDTRGHDFGDKLLQDVAGRLSAIMRESDTLARLGGDEFVVILVSVKGQESFTTAAQRLLSVFYQPFEIEGRQIYTSASIGMAIFPDDGHDGELLLKCADTAMYRVKQEGRSGFRFFSAEMNEQIVRRVTLESSLHRALANNEFFLLYQPQWDTRTQRIIGAEALLRWQSSTFGLILPADFISLIEDSGLIFSIGEWVLRTACLQARQWSSLVLPDFRVGVNISGKQLNQPDFLAVVARVLGETGAAPRSIALEFTESTIMEHAETTIETLLELRKMGLLLNIDNFGSGYSALNYLKNFPIDRIMVDRSFIADLSPENGSGSIVKAIMSIAEVLKVRVMAEGVETESQKQRLEELGCREMQGYLLGMPMTAGELEEKIIQG